MNAVLSVSRARCKHRRTLYVIERYDHALADTIALMSNCELQAILDEDDQHPETAVPFDERLLARG